MDMRWMAVNVETGAADGRYTEREDAEGSARYLREKHGGTWLVVKVVSIHGPGRVSIPSDRMFHANYFDLEMGATR
jgi:hypothetical protein